MVLEAEEPRNLLFGSARTGKWCGKFPLSPKTWEPGARCLRAGEDGQPSSRRERELVLPDFLFHLGLGWTGWWPLTCGVVTFLSQARHSNVKLFWKHSQRNTRSHVLPATWASLLAPSN